LELTESLLLEDREGVIATIQALTSRGIGLSLDKFCTGGSHTVAPRDLLANQGCKRNPGLLYGGPLAVGDFEKLYSVGAISVVPPW
jgi:hypothetical protein